MARNHWQYVIREVVIKISADICALQSRNHGEVPHSGNQVGCSSTTIPSNLWWLTLTFRGLQSWQSIICNCWHRSFSREGCLYKRYFYLAGEVFHLAEEFLTWQERFSPGREDFHLAGEVARWILSQGARDMNWPGVSTIVWPASTLLPIAITDPARPPAVAVVYTCGLQSPISATNHTVGTSWPLTIDQLKHYQQ